MCNAFPASMRGHRKAAANAIAFGDDDPFDYALALDLGWSHAQVQQLPYDEYVRWRAFYAWRATEQEHAAKVAAMRRR